MWKCKIVEDDKRATARLLDYLKRFEGETGERFEVVCYEDAVTFLTEYNADCDIVFMDIEMPYLNGMDASKKLRERDSEVALVFITNMVQYAVSGYEVRALDFIVKPVSYYNFVIKLKRVLADRKLKRERGEELLLSCETGVKRIVIDSIRYIEVVGHRLTFHTLEETVELSGSLKDMESELEQKHFSRCNNCYLVNLKYVSEITANSCFVGGEELQISRRRKKGFIDDLTLFMGEN